MSLTVIKVTPHEEVKIQLTIITTISITSPKDILNPSRIPQFMVVVLAMRMILTMIVVVTMVVMMMVGVVMMTMIVVVVVMMMIVLVMVVGFVSSGCCVLLGSRVLHLSHQGANMQTFLSFRMTTVMRMFMMSIKRVIMNASLIKIHVETLMISISDGDKG